MKFRNALSLSALACLPVLATAQGCSVDEAPQANTPNNVTEVNHSFRGKWAVDMKKVDQEYGTSSEYFLGQTPQEAALPQQVLDGMAAQGFQHPPLWDQTAKREADGSLHQDTGDEIAVIDRQGNHIDPVGYVNIIPMLKDTDPSKQVHIKEFLNDGDVIVYFHPEQTGPRGAMERRASHVGMHYEYEADGKEIVHHIDNPNSYGPIYNHKPERQMPFHVYRFKPRKGDLAGAAATDVVETVEGVGFSAGQVGGVLELANMGDINHADEDVAKEARKELHKTLVYEIGLRPETAGRIIQYRYHNGTVPSLAILGNIAEVHASDLRFMRDYVAGDEVGGAPVTADQAIAYGEHARDWAMITNDLSPFANFFDLRLQKLGDLGEFASNAINGEDIPNLYCSGLAYANLNLAINFPLNQAGLGDLYSTFSSSNYYFSDANGEIPASALEADGSLRSLNRLVFAPYGPSDIIDAWITNYWSYIPDALKTQIFQTPEFQQQIVAGFGQLEWSDDQTDEKQSAGQFKPATIENVARWSAAYGKDASATDEFLANDPELAASFEGLGLSKAGMTPMDIVKTVEDAFVDNKFVPPQIWMDEADKENASLVYVGTVLNCEILTSVDGSGEEACAMGGGGVTQWSEGAADTSTYPHYAVQNASFLAHRRFDVAGPANFGPDSMVSYRATHGEMGDVRFILHVPENWVGTEQADMPYQEYREWCNTERENGGHCAAPQGILLEPNTGGPVDDQTFTFRLGDVCDFSDDGTTATCPMASSVGGFQELGTVELSTWADGGRITGTMVDLGGDSNVDLENCSACTTSGGHYNQFTVNLQQGGN